MAQTLVFRILTIYISGVFILFSFYYLYANVLLYKSFADNRKYIPYSTFIINAVEVCLATTLLYYSMLLLNGSLLYEDNMCIKKIKPWLKVEACVIAYYIVATPSIKHEKLESNYLLIAFFSWFIVFIYYNLLRLKNNAQVSMPISVPGPPPSDEIHELVISNDLPPAYNTLKHYEEAPPPSYISAITDNHGPFLSNWKAVNVSSSFLTMESTAFGAALLKQLTIPVIVIVFAVYLTKILEKFFFAETTGMINSVSQSELHEVLLEENNLI